MALTIEMRYLEQKGQKGTIENPDSYYDQIKEI